MFAAPSDRSGAVLLATGAALPALYAQCAASNYGFTLAEFAALLAEVERFYLGSQADAAERSQLLATLHLGDLVLARACARGHETAWVDFLRLYQPKLRMMALSLVHDRQQALDLADSLHAHLYGLAAKDGTRVSKLDRYMGGGSLEAWLRTVLAQRRVDEWRRRRATVNWEDAEPALLRATVAAPAEPSPRLLVVTALRAALGRLKAEQKLMLTLYFLDGRHLAEIGRLFGVHESTMSRRLRRVETNLRRAVVRELLHRGLDRRAAEDALCCDVRTLELDLRHTLAPMEP